MKSFFLFLALMASVAMYSQAASKVNNAQNVYAVGQPRVVLSCDTLLSGLFRLYPKDVVTWKFSQLTNKPTTLSGYGITDAVDIPSFTWTNLAGKPTFATVATSGDYNDLINQPTIPTNNNQLTNGSNYIAATGTTAQYFRGDGSLATFPSIVTYTAGTGISLGSNIITNTAPDQVVSITGDNYITASGTYPNFTVARATRTFNNAPGRSIVTVAAAANGFQISSTKDANVSYSVTINTSVSLSGNSSGYVVLEICPTNSAVAANWIEISRVPSGQSGTLVIGLVLNQAGGGCISGIVPAGYFARLRSVNVAGSPSYGTAGQQEVY